MTTDVRPVDTGLSALSDLNVTNDDVVSAVRQVYARHPFPPPQRMTDYYDQEIPLDLTHHSVSPEFAERISGLSFQDRCDVIDMIARHYWISLFAQKAP